MSKENCEFCDGEVEGAVRRVPFHYRKELIYVDHGRSDVRPYLNRFRLPRVDSHSIRALVQCQT